MPSGSKKRKAAKKKKEAAHYHDDNNHPTNAAAIHRHGDDDLKHHDDKESDAEDVSSPVSEDHPNNHHQFTDRDKEEVENAEYSSHVQSSSEENKPVEGLKEDIGATQKTVEEEFVTRIEKELTAARELNSESVIVEKVEPKKESGDGVLSQSLDEGNVIEIQSDLKPIDEVEPKKESGDVVLSRPLDEGSIIQIPSDVKPMDELDSEKVIIEHVDTLKESKDGDLLQNQEEEPRVVDKTNVVVDNTPFVGSTEAVNSFFEGLTHVPNIIPVGENYKSAMESGAFHAVDKVILPDEKINGIKSASANVFMTSDIVVPETEENGEKVVILQESNGRMLPVCMDLGSENKGVEAIVKTDVVIATSDAKVSASQETEEKLILSRAVAGNGAEHTKDSKVPEFSGSQDFRVSAPPIVQRTSWMNCCGLFEVFGGTHR